MLPGLIEYHAVALLLLVALSLTAMFFDIMPVLVAAVLSALIWDVLFIPPRFSLAIDTAEDALLFAMYFIIACVHAVLTSKIRQMEELSRKKEEKESTLKLYNTLLNSLSHELRTPISTIIGATDNLMTDSAKLTIESKDELIREISKASFRLNSQVENLLNMSRIESGFLEPKKDWVDISELIYDVINKMRDSLGSHIVEVQLKDDLPLFKLDYGLMEQALYNLISNAAIYIPKYSVITVRAFCVKESLIIHVEDTGQGFPHDQIEKVFDKFYRVKNSVTGGTGLGLSIVKGFIEAHGGTIRLENLPDTGSRFTIEIPVEISSLKMIRNEGD